jgi:dynamin 1-like protein
MVDNLVKIEQSFINTNHPEFMTAGPAFQAVLKKVEERRRKDLQMVLSSSSSSASQDEVPVQPVMTPSGVKDRDGGILSYLFKYNPPATTTATTTNQPPPSPNKHERKRHNIAEPLTEREEFETQLIMTLLHGYFAIVKRNLVDTVPKACMHFLVNTVMERLPSRLVAELYKEDLFSELLREDDGVVRERERCRRDMDALQSALQVLGELNDI